MKNDRIYQVSSSPTKKLEALKMFRLDIMKFAPGQKGFWANFQMLQHDVPFEMLQHCVI